MKRGLVLISLVFLILFISVFVSAFSFIDFWNKITGRVTSICTDTDEGINYYVKGTVQSDGYTSSDFCSNSTLLREYYCSENISISKPYNCLKGCLSGACNLEKTSTDVTSANYADNTFSPDTSVSVPTVTASDNLEFQGYIVELTGEPLVVKEKQITTSNPAISKSVVMGNLQTAENNLESEQETFKQNALSILGKNSIATGSAVSDTQLQVWEEYDKTFNGFALNITTEEAEKIKTISGVKSVSPNYRVYLSLKNNIPTIDAEDVWKLDVDRNLCATSGKSCLTGKGIRIGIIDTGVDYTHPDLGGCFGTGCKVAGGWDFNAGLGGIIQDRDPMDEHGHGTHVASIAAGNGVLKGVAPDATIYAYKVMGPAGYQYSSSVIAAIDRSVDPNRDGDMSDHLDIISLSLGGKGNPDDATSRAVDRAVDAGVVVVVSAGNDGPDANTIGSPGTARQAITVGNNQGYLCDGHRSCVHSTSSRGPVIWKGNTLTKPDITAPGIFICASKASAYVLDVWSPSCIDNQHVVFSGTSMSTPFVSGTAALLLQEHPDWTPAKIKLALTKSAINLKDELGKDYDINTQGYGALNVLNAVKINIACESPGELCFLTSDCCNPSACVNRKCTFVDTPPSNTSEVQPLPIVTCKSSSNTCVFDNYRQSNCCNRLRCAEPEFFNPSKGKCIACISSGKIPPNQRGGKLSNLCCSGNWKWIWNWFKSGYYCI